MDTQQNITTPVSPSINQAETVIPNQKPVIDTSSTLLPPKTPNVSNTPPPGYKPKKSIFSRILKLFLLILFIGGIGAAAYFLYPKYGPTLLKLVNRPKSNEQTTKIIEPTYVSIPTAKSIFGNITSSSAIIAFTQLDETSMTTKLKFYDSNSKKLLPEDKTIESDKNTIYSIGPWSPNGTYLPILSQNASDETRNFYIFNSKTLKITKLLSKNKADPTYLDIPATLDFGTYWLDENTYSFNNTGIINGNLDTISTSGKFEKKANTSKYGYHNNQIRYEFTNPLDDKTASVSVGSEKLTFVPEGSPIGVIDGLITTLVTPEVVSLIDLSDPKNAKSKEMELKFNEIESSTKTKEEKQRQMLDLLEPNGPTTLNFYAVETGNIDKTIDLTSDVWQTVSALIHPSEKFVIVHQTNTLLSPTKERFLVVTPANSDPIKVLVEKDLVKTGDLSFSTLKLHQGVSFFITNNGEWLITMEGSFKEAATSKINMTNISTGEVLPICESNCFSMRAHYPYAFVEN